MDYKDFIKPGEKVIHFPEDIDYNLWMYGPEVVTIGKYRPYYTDGSADPKPEEYNEWCWVEVEKETSWGGSQLCLCSLRPIIKEKKEVVYNSKVCKLIGYDEEKDFAVIETDEKLRVVYADEVDEIRHVPDLSRRELQELRKQISVGSIYLSDYCNTLGVPREEASNYAEGYLDYLREEYGEDWESHDTPEMFDYYCS